MEDLLRRVADEVARFRAGLSERPVVAADAAAARDRFAGPLPEHPTPPGEVVDQLVAAADAGVVASAGPRFFGFVTGGALPAATAADMLAPGWDQCAFNPVLSPAAYAAERAAGAWLKELLGIPATASAGFVTGGQAANTVGLCAARHHVLAQAGWDVERDGLAGAPPVRVLASEERHTTIDRSLRLLGFGTVAVQPVQVLVSFGDDARTDRMVEAVQQDGTCWMGGTTWRGRRLMRISVSNATTTEADIDRSLAAIRRLALQI